MTHHRPTFQESLYDAAARLEHQRHHARMAELEAMRKRLQLLDAHVRPLLDQGVVILPTEIQEGEAGALSPLPDLLTDGQQAWAIEAFKALGFTEPKPAHTPVDQRTPFKKVHLCNGHLHLQFTVYRHTPQAKP